MNRIAIFGAGICGATVKRVLQEDLENEIVCFIDNDKSKWGTSVDNVPVVAPSDCAATGFDSVVIGVYDYEKIMTIYRQLLTLDISKDRIKTAYEVRELAYGEKDARVAWARTFSIYCEKEGIGGNVAECGVFRGDFSHFLNKYFTDRKLYLFDIFEDLAFNEIDLKAEPDLSEFFSLQLHNFENTSVDIVMNKMSRPDDVIIKKGWFPETANGVEDTFCFVNLDMDLYRPTLDGLRFFWDKTERGGGILIHDYFYNEQSQIRFPGIKQAVDDFEKEQGIGIPRTVIGDYCSILLVKA
jgi:hypothetical protein